MSSENRIYLGTYPQEKIDAFSGNEEYLTGYLFGFHARTLALYAGAAARLRGLELTTSVDEEFEIELEHTEEGVDLYIVPKHDVPVDLILLTVQ